MQALADAAIAGPRTIARRCAGCRSDLASTVTEPLDDGAFFGCAEELVREYRLEFLPVYADRCIQPVHTDEVTAGLLAAAGA